MNATVYRAKLVADVAERKAAVNTAVQHLAKAEEKLQLFDDITRGTVKVPVLPSPVKRKPGRPAKVKAAQAVEPKRKPGRPRKEPTEAPKKKGGRPRKTDATPPKKPGRPAKAKLRAAAGRAAVARGDRPSIKEAVRTVMGDKTLNANEILELVKARNWTPDSNDPKTYIAYILSATKAYFERVPSKGRGYYKVRKEALPKGNGKAKAEAPKVKAPKVKVAAPKAAPPKVEAPKVEAPKVEAAKAEPPPKPKKGLSVDTIIAEAISPMGTFGE